MQKIKISGTDDLHLMELFRLSEADLRHYYEPERGLFMAESPKVISRALDAGYEPAAFLADERELERSRELQELTEKIDDGVPFYIASEEAFRTITGFPMTRGALCAMRRPQPAAPEDLCEGKKRVVVLENVVNPANVGAIFRSAAAMFAECILLTDGCSDPLYRRAARVSMGTVFQIPWAYISGKDGDNAASPARLLKKLGFSTAALALRDDACSIGDPELKKEERLALFLGTEGSGLSKTTIEECDYVVKIPMSCGVDSLNVAAASAVAFWELYRKNNVV